jgi:hypothetical protein
MEFKQELLSWVAVVVLASVTIGATLTGIRLISKLSPAKSDASAAKDLPAARQVISNKKAPIYEQAQVFCVYVQEAEFTYFRKYGRYTTNLTRLNLIPPEFGSTTDFAFSMWNMGPNWIGFGLVGPGGHKLGMDLDVVNGEPNVRFFWWRTDTSAGIGGGYFNSSKDGWIDLH